ncbi:hypothetical protein FS935_01915 [Metabacillus litoralis]|uniref:Uncharacterized protein n=1 Tax=Metabacillus litoralis TaxID=152268 RepID=A0A5C6W6F4_9BACI|nr:MULTISPECIES: hypothetical protein [Metabacillus]MBM7602345.1 hypothetical protein [Metabacillus crassostreae]TXC92974.1 hypothetical protein FS935_01915 [Metabacillus litoralis]
MLAKIKKVKLNKEGKNPNYKVLLECPEGKDLYIHFDYTYATAKYWPLEVNYNGKNQGAKLAWYSSKIEKLTVAGFLEGIADKINKKYEFELKR